MNAAYSFDAIEAEHDRLGYKLGWRFLACPEQRVSQCRLLIATLNPGGSERHGPPWSQEDGNAYEVEKWNRKQDGPSALQNQVRQLVAFAGYEFNDVLAAYFVPFRSSRWADLTRKGDAIVFACRLWEELLAKIDPELVVCVGNEVGRHLTSMMHVENLRAMPTGWGTVSLRRGALPNGSPFIILPHLSTFKLFGKPECLPFLRAAFSPAIARRAVSSMVHHA